MLQRDDNLLASRHLRSGERYIIISIAEQRLRIFADRQCIFDVAVSTAGNGPGEINGSNCTPRGWHQVRVKIGAGCLPNTVFVKRRPTGEIYTPALRQQFPNRDWILTRILWLSGLEPGKNRYGNVDTLRRFIYLHGSPDDVAMGKPGSHGCVRMRNTDIIELFDRVDNGVPVLITED